MTSPARTIRDALRVAVPVFAAAAALFAPVVPALTVRPRASSFPPVPPLVVGPAFSREGFELSYTHSVNKGRVTDSIDIGPSGDLVVRKSRFVSYGAGMGEPAEGGEFVRDGDFAEGGGFFEMTGLDRVVPRVHLAVGVTARHEIARAGRTYALANRFAPRTSVIIEYRPVSAFDLLLSGPHRK